MVNRAFRELEDRAFRAAEEHDQAVEDKARQFVMARHTQHAIIKAAEQMAEVLAEAGRASAKAIGDSTNYAIDRWARVIAGRAKEIAGGRGARLEAPFRCSCGRTYKTFGGLEECLEENHFPAFPREIEG
jgi:hypothetical protein